MRCLPLGLIALVLVAAERPSVEVTHRAQVAASTAANAIRQSAASGRQVVVVYVSSGYTRDVSPEFAVVSQAAAQVGAQIFAFDPRRPPVDGRTVVTTAEWNAYVAETQEALRAISVATGGTTAFTDADIETMVDRIRR